VLCLLAARDAYLVTMLQKLDTKLDTLMRIVSQMSADSTPAEPELPDDIMLPLKSISELETLERIFTENASVKSSMVSVILVICTLNLLSPTRLFTPVSVSLTCRTLFNRSLHGGLSVYSLSTPPKLNFYLQDSKTA